MTTHINPGTVLPVAYAHTVDYFSKGVDERGPFYRVNYYINNWTDSDTVVNALRGISTATGASTGAISRTSPHQHPLSPNLFCFSAVATGVGQPITNANGYPSYSAGAVITAEYRPMVPYGYAETPNEQLQQIDPNTPILWCTQELDFTTETFTFQNSQVTWSAGPHSGQPITGLAFRMRVPITQMILTFHKLPYLPAGQVMATTQGKVNSALFLAQPIGTVLFSGARITRDWNDDGTVCQKMQLTFLARTGSDSLGSAQTWNRLPDPKDLNWYTVTGSGGATLYQGTDLNVLVTF